MEATYALFSLPIPFGHSHANSKRSPPQRISVFLLCPFLGQSQTRMDKARGRNLPHRAH